MIIQTRWRDVPWVDVSHDFRAGKKRLHQKGWPTRRGKKCRIVGPPRPIGTPHQTLACKGPFYRMVKKDGTPMLTKAGLPCSVCHHVAEIGD